MSQLIVVANRGPVSMGLGPDGSLTVSHAGGGLAPSLSRALRNSGALWIASAMNEAEHLAAERGVPSELTDGIDLSFVAVDPQIQALAYNTIANATLWMVHHGMFDRAYRPVFDAAWHRAWEAYRSFNAAFAEEVCRRAAPGATVVVHDYHLSLVGTFLKAARPDLATVYFSHTPFGSPDELAVLPDAVRLELLAGLVAFGACGFHTGRWAESFTECVAHHRLNLPEVFVAPLGTDPEELAEVAVRPSVAAKREALRERLGDTRLIVRTDRLEPSKNLIRGFLAFGELLERAPQWRGRVHLLARSYASRTALPEYVAYREAVEAAVDDVNARFAEGGAPVITLALEDDFEASVAALSCADLLLVNPIRDGMNLVAKEGPVLSTVDGVLVLSTEAGAYEELGRDALGVNPFDVSGTAAALAAGLEMAPEERATRAGALRRTAGAAPPARWLADVIAEARQP